ncbi:hypothetical protein KAJ27_22145 [bacterium]|nr:hypothetical protein [bacterium]
MNLDKIEMKYFGIAISNLILAVFVLVICFPLWIWYGWRIEVPAEHLAVLIHKSGENLPPEELIAKSDKYKGIQLNTLSEGRYFYCPIFWDWAVKKQFIVPGEKSGIIIRNFGKDLEPGKLLAEEGYKGILPEPLSPGRYSQYNPSAYQLVLVPAVTVRAGYVGVVTLRIGKTPEKRNTFLVESGEQGVQKQTLSPGTYYINYFKKSISEVSLRSHRFDMEGQMAILFPSKDGFDITLEGTIEWFIDKERVAEVFMKYNDRANKDTFGRVTTFTDKVINKVILPNARAFSRIQGSKYIGKEFISGKTRKLFQKAFLKDLRKACQQDGIVIKSALVKTIRPPVRIARVIKDREIARREQEKYEKEKDTQISAKSLAMEELMVLRGQLINDSQRGVSVMIKEADKNAEVKIIGAEQKLDVSQRNLKASINNSKSILAKADAKSKVILFNNLAEAKALQGAINAFGGGQNYARHAFLKKIAPGIENILDNTDGIFSSFFTNFNSTVPKQKSKQEVK